ncbi:MAG: cation transporter [Candidatus Moraniibacteriota bacterium]
MVSDALSYAMSGAYALLVLFHILRGERLDLVRKVCEFFLGAFLVLTAFGIFADAGGRLWWGMLPVVEHGSLLFSVAAIGFAVNGSLLLLFRTFGLGHDHGSQAQHGHNHSHGTSGDTILRANFWHTFGDAASSLLVMVNAIVFSITDDPVWGRLDLAVSLVIAAVLFYQGIATFAAQEE